MNHVRIHLCTQILLLFTTVVVDASDDNLTKYYVVPTNGNISLCQQSVTQKCLTFKQYTNHQDRYQYFHSNSTFIFQLGVHQLNASLSLSNVRNISFRGESLSTSTAGDGLAIVYLNPKVSLSWTNCDQIEIRSLSFVSFGNYDYWLMFINVHNVLLSNISIIGNGCSDDCSAIDCQSSTVSISNSTLAGIHGEFGGIFVLNSSQIIFNGANILINNRANLGVAIHAINSEIQISGELNLSVECDLSCRSFYQSREEDKTLCTFENSTINTFSSLAAKNYYIRFCNGSFINNTHTESELSTITKEVIPGQTFNLTVTMIGQDNTLVRGTVVNMNANSTAKYHLSPATQTILSAESQSCETFDYRFYVTGDEPNNGLVSYRLFLDGPCVYQSLADGIEIRLSILPCPLGFTLDSNNGKCVCNKWLQPLTQDCFIDNQSILRARNNFWVGVYQTLNDTEGGLILIHSGSCPLNYCVDNPINITLGDPDVQCHEGRGETLCSTCQENFSLALGSLNCLSNCSNAHLALLIPFALLGVIVVITLFLLHLTVAAGTINGLILYANIVQANHRAFFPPSTINNYYYFSTVFIAWLNLDFGIETCFYDGLTIYSYSWLEFLFPLYLWILIIIIIVASHYSQRVSNSLGHNAVAVLNTILFMSYSKILKATIIPLTPTSISMIHFPTNTTVKTAAE